MIFYDNKGDDMIINNKVEEWVGIVTTNKIYNIIKVNL